MKDHRLLVTWKGRRCVVKGGNFDDNGYAFIEAVGFEGMRKHRVDIDEITNPELIRNNEK